MTFNYRNGGLEMSYKVTISGTVLEKCIEHVSFCVDTFNDGQTTPRNSIIITGQIDTEEGTAGLYNWALLSGANPDCYKEVTVEQYQKTLLVRKVTFSKAFVIDYSESYSNSTGTGTFTLYIRQLLSKEIEVTSEETNSKSNVVSEVANTIKEPAEVVQEKVAVVPKAESTKKTAMSFTDRLAKNNELQDNRNIPDIPPAFRQTEFASTYEARIGQTPAETNTKVGFERKEKRGESLCTLKPPPDTELKKILDEAGINGIEYRNAVPDFSPTAKAQVEIDHMYGGIGANGNKARRSNFAQADEKLTEQLNKSPELASKFGMKSGEITADDVKDYRMENNLTWHELNDTKTVQLVPSEINGTFGHLGGVGEINAGAFKSGGFAAN